MRSLRRSAELVVRALSFWHSHFCTAKLPDEKSPNGSRKTKGGLSNLWRSSNKTSTLDQVPLPKKTPSDYKKWNLDAKNLNSSVFTTVYTADLESLIEDLTSGKIKKKKAFDQLQVMRQKMETPAVNKRAIPGYLPTDKNIYRGICGLVILGAKPSAMTISDSQRLKIPPPMDYNSDGIRVSMKRLILVLTRLGLSQTNDGEDVATIIRKLWKEVNEYCSPKEHGKGYNSVDVESSQLHDEVELGMLKWHMYGVSANQPSWFSKVFCMPCSPGVLKSDSLDTEHPASEMTKKSGDLVWHDVIECNLCRHATGCVESPKTSSSANNSARLLLKETESDDSCNSHGNEIEITQTILQTKSGIGAAENTTFFPS